MFKILNFDNLKKILLSTLLFNIIFFKIPIEIFYFNRPDFQNFVFLLFPTVTIFLISLSFYKKIYSNKKLFNILVALSIYLILSKIFVPLNINELEGNLEKPTELKFSILFELIIFIFSFYLIKFFNKKYFINFLTIFAAIIFFSTSYYFVRSIASVIKHQYNYFDIFDHTSNFHSIKNENPNIKNENPNIYLITFDAFSSFALEKILEENDEYKNVFTDFEFFINNSSNYSHTSLSVPSFLTGSIYNFDSKISEWKNNYRTNGLISDLIKKQYEVWQYVQSNDMKHDKVNLVTTNIDLLINKSKVNLLIELFDFVLLRISPQFLHQEIYNNGSGILSKFSNKFNNNEIIIPGEHFRAIGSKMLFEKIIEEEEKRSQKGIFLHAHIYIPHGPYVLNEKAEYDPSSYDSETGKIRYMIQTKGVIYLINKFLEKLKYQNKFKDSLIIINADHGSWEIGLEKLPEEFSYREKSLNDNLRQLPGHYLFNQSKSLLLLKKPKKYSNLPIKINYAKTQLIDIYPTIKKFSGQQIINNESQMMSLMDQLPDDRTIEYYVGYKQRKSPSHPWTTIEKKSGGYIDLFEISNSNFIYKKDRFYANW